MDPQQQPKKRILFVCMDNAARSQMAEGLLNEFGGGKFAVMSAGIKPAQEVSEDAIAVMKEIGIDISHYKMKSVDLFRASVFDFGISVCDMNTEQCPLPAGGKQILRWSFRDPSKATGSHEEELTTYRDLLDAISAKITEELLPLLK